MHPLILFLSYTIPLSHLVALEPKEVPKDLSSSKFWTTLEIVLPDKLFTGLNFWWLPMRGHRIQHSIYIVTSLRIFGKKFRIHPISPYVVHGLGKDGGKAVFFTLGIVLISIRKRIRPEKIEWSRKLVPESIIQLRLAKNYQSLTESRPSMRSLVLLALRVLPSKKRKEFNSAVTHQAK